MIQDELINSRLKLNLTRKEVVNLSGIKETEFIKLENGNYRKMNPNDFEKLESVLKLDRTFKKMYVSPYSDLTFLKERREKLGYTLREAEKLTGINIMQISRMENGKTSRVSLRLRLSFLATQPIPSWSYLGVPEGFKVLIWRDKPSRL